MPSRHIAYLAYYFPPLSITASLRSAKLAKYLSACGWDITVISARHRYRLAHDHSLVHDIPSHVSVRRTFNPEPSSFLPYRYRHILDDHLLPDRHRYWIPFALRALATGAAQRPYDAVMATGDPWTSLLVATDFAEERHLPVLLDFRDPWTHDTDRVWRTEARKAAEERIEATILGRADAVTTVNAQVADMLLGAYPYLRNRIQVVPNGFDPQDFPPSTANRSPMPDHFTIRSIGSIYGFALVEEFFDAILAAAQEEPTLLRHLRLEFCGAWYHRELRPLAARKNLSGSISLVGRIDHDLAVSKMKTASVLLLFRPQEWATSAKLFEYIAAARPILAITPPDGAAASLLTYAPDPEVVSPGDSHALTQSILRLYRRWLTRHSGDAGIVDPRFREQFGYDRIAERLATTLNSLGTGIGSPNDRA